MSGRSSVRNVGGRSRGITIRRGMKNFIRGDRWIYNGSSCPYEAIYSGPIDEGFGLVYRRWKKRASSFSMSHEAPLLSISTSQKLKKRPIERFFAVCLPLHFYIHILHVMFPGLQITI